RHVRGVDATGAAFVFARADPKLIALFQIERLTALERARADLRSAEVLQHGDLASTPGARSADFTKRSRVRLVRAVRKIPPDDIGADVDERVQQPRPRRCRAERGDDLRAPDYFHGSTSAFGRRIASASRKAPVNSPSPYVRAPILRNGICG